MTKTCKINTRLEVSEDGDLLRDEIQSWSHEDLRIGLMLQYHRIGELVEKVNQLKGASVAVLAEVDRLTPLQYRPAPCHTHCEAQAFKVDLRRLTAELAAANTKIKTLEGHQ